MLVLFQVCFFVGLGLALVSFICGHVFSGFGVDGLDFSAFGMDVSLPLSPIPYILGITVFGGIGWILWKTENPPALVFIILIAAAAGILIAVLFQLFIIKPLKKAENTSAPDAEELIGLLAVVTEKIPAHGFGEITYVIHGNSFAAPAKATTDAELAKGSEVSICWIEDHVFYVAEINI